MIQVCWLDIVLAGIFFAPVPFSEKPPALKTEADVKAAIARLGDEKTDPAALEQLIDFASIRIFQVGSVFGVYGDGMDALRDKVAAVVARRREFPTIRMALTSSRTRLQFWALWVFPTRPTEGEKRWQSLHARIRELAVKGPVDIRRMAQQRLMHMAGNEEFLAECVKSETSLRNIMRLVYGGNGQGFDERMNAHVLRFLLYRDEKVQREALLFIGGNSIRAPMWQVKFTDKVFQRTRELSRSRNSKEREHAVAALIEIRRREPDELRKLLMPFARDESEDVRWQIPGALKDQQQRADVKKLLGRLLHDKSAMVRYFTILSLGPRKYVKELQTIAAGKDRAAEFAATTLKGLAREKESAKGAVPD